MIPPRDALAVPEPAAALGANILGFVRLLRRAGMPVGPGEALLAAEAVSVAGVEERAVVKAALRATLVRRHDQSLLFDAAFDLFWRDPERARAGAALALTEAQRPEEKPRAGGRRLAEAMAGPRPPPPPPGEEKPLHDAAMTVSDREALQRMDFEAMSAEQIAAAKREIRRLALRLETRPTRRFRRDPAGPRVDLRATLREASRTGGEIAGIARRRRVRRAPPLVAICDISGSMSRYAQVLLHFLHAVVNERDRVHCFLFGTRLTNITRQLRHKDPEIAFEMVGHMVPDWSGGTRIGEALEEFNHRWGRRVLGQGAVVLLITDGLDREGGLGLAEATERLRRSCRRLIWLNPLLRYAGFEPRSQGIRAMLPHVHEFRPVHNLESLRDLVAALAPGGSEERRR
ncbi:vWA domain-containing protein [Sabulicella rubraurantiaca]|uniref:vWA domain-containing protein n=1 Tax=Sabulicella rubraurantiaca TaxID=2811429 RepID=UPI002E28E8F3|nr:VWA domain-containing protein [Sabulicella rubraurantiaca]